jgi:hypothetical protein
MVSLFFNLGRVPRGLGDEYPVSWGSELAGIEGKVARPCAMSRKHSKQTIEFGRTLQSGPQLLPGQLRALFFLRDLPVG